MNCKNLREMVCDCDPINLDGERCAVHGGMFG